MTPTPVAFSPDAGPGFFKVVTPTPESQQALDLVQEDDPLWNPKYIAPNLALGENPMTLRLGEAIFEKFFDIDASKSEKQVNAGFSGALSVYMTTDERHLHTKDIDNPFYKLSLFLFDGDAEALRESDPFIDLFEEHSMNQSVSKERIVHAIRNIDYAQNTFMTMEKKLSRGDT